MPRCLEDLWPCAGAGVVGTPRRGPEQGGRHATLSIAWSVLPASASPFDSGEIFCVMGLSGSGKSTLVRHINGLIQPTAGQILIDGQDIGRQTRRELRRMRAEKIGMVFQNFALLPHRSVIDNVAFGLELREVAPAKRIARADDMLKLVDLADWGHHWPHELSGGMQQRVGLARAPGGRSRHPADGRAVRRARSADPPAIAGRVPAAVARHAQDDDLHHPRS